jgi:hypothetical protein
MFVGSINPDIMLAVPPASRVQIIVCGSVNFCSDSKIKIADESGAVNAADTPAPAPAAIKFLRFPLSTLNKLPVKYPVKDPICTDVPFSSQ